MMAHGAGPAGQPSHISHRRCACPAPPLQWDGGDGGTMAKDDTASKRLAEEISHEETLTHDEFAMLLDLTRKA